MRNYILIFVITLMFFSCKEKNIRVMTTQTRTDTLLTKVLSDKFHKFQLIYSQDSISNILKKIIITDKSKNLKIQEINVDTIELPKNDIYFNIDEDVNFDGYNDLSIVNYVGAYSTSLSFWLYDKKNKKFKHYKGLDNVQNPAILKDKKEICSKWHAGLTAFYLEKYFWEKDSLILKEKYEESDTDKKRLTTTKLVNNKYVVKDSVIKERNVMFMECK